MKSGYYHRISSTALAVLDCCPYGEKGVIITRINVPTPYRGRGYASMLLREVCRDADAEGINLFLEIVPSNDGTGTGLDYAALEGWYRRHGFRPVDNGPVFKRRFASQSKG